MELSIKPHTIIMCMINFAIFFFIYKRYFHDKVNKILIERNSKISNEIKEAKANREESDKLLLENKKLLIDSKNESKQLIEEYKSKAEKVYEEIVDEAHLETRRTLERTSLEIQREKQKAEEEIKEKAIELAITLSSRVLERAIDEKEHRRLIDDFISKVGI